MFQGKGFIVLLVIATFALDQLQAKPHVIPPKIIVKDIQHKVAVAAIKREESIKASGVAIASIATAPLKIANNLISIKMGALKAAKAVKTAAVVKGAALAKGAAVVKGAAIVKGVTALKGVKLLKVGAAVKAATALKSAKLLKVGAAVKGATALKAGAAAKGAAVLKAGAAAKGAAVLKAGAVGKGAAVLKAGALAKGAAVLKTAEIGDLLAKKPVIVKPVIVEPVKPKLVFPDPIKIAEAVKKSIAGFVKPSPLISIDARKPLLGSMDPIPQLNIFTKPTPQLNVVPVTVPQTIGREPHSTYGIPNYK